jgi:hypothetical protein
MASNWDSMYTQAANTMLEKNVTLTRALLLALVAAQNPTTFKAGSQGPTDYRGTLDEAGNVVRVGSQSTQYKPLLFVGTGDSYTAVPVDKRVAKPGSKGISKASDAELQAELQKRGLL